MGFVAGNGVDDLEAKLPDVRLPKAGVLYLETPANPTNALVDIGRLRHGPPLRALASLSPLIVDNTFLGPLWQHPLEHGADLVIYSATKFIGGHSDLIAGACLGSEELMRASGYAHVPGHHGRAAGPVGCCCAAWRRSSCA